MRRLRLTLTLPLILAVAAAGCDSTTDISEVEATGRWDGVGALEASFSGIRLELNEAADGTITGTWRQGGSAAGVVGSNNNGNLQLTLALFPGGPATFEGRFTDRYRMAGTLNGVALDGEAVFRRASFTP